MTLLELFNKINSLDIPSDATIKKIGASEVVIDCSWDVANNTLLLIT
jgi:hypothetical protein